MRLASSHKSFCSSLCLFVIVSDGRRIYENYRIQLLMMNGVGISAAFFFHFFIHSIIISDSFVFIFFLLVSVRHKSILLGS